MAVWTDVAQGPDGWDGCAWVYEPVPRALTDEQRPGCLGGACNREPFLPAGPPDPPPGPPPPRAVPQKPKPDAHVAWWADNVPPPPART